MKAFRISGSVSGFRLKAVFGYPYSVANSLSCRDEHRSGLDRTGSGLKPIFGGSGLDRTAILKLVDQDWMGLRKFLLF